MELVARGKFILEEFEKFIHRISNFAVEEDGVTKTFGEGIVVKPDREIPFDDYIAGKWIRKEFEDNIDEHYLRKERRYNIVDPKWTST